jgi:hypothetical protein
MKHYYTGIGSRKTPPEICELMTKIASLLEEFGYTLRSGGADGADSAFEAGVRSELNKEIYLPWKKFNGSTSKHTKPSPEAFLMASTIHPVWDKLSYGAKALHARNIHQVLGADLNTPSELLICWTDGGGVTGGTATAIKIAKQRNISVWNLFDEKDRKEWEERLELFGS